MNKEKLKINIQKAIIFTLGVLTGLVIAIGWQLILVYLGIVLAIALYKGLKQRKIDKAKEKNIFRKSAKE